MHKPQWKDKTLPYYSVTVAPRILDFFCPASPSMKENFEL